MSDGRAVIGLEVGDGGGSTARFIRDEIVSRFGNASLGQLEDASIAELAGVSIAVTTDTYVVQPPVFPGGDIGRLAICGTVNDLVASGAEPRYLTLGLVMTAGIESALVGRVLDSAAAAAKEAGVTVVAGDTKVIPDTGGPEIILNTAGVGVPLFADRSFALRDARDGDAIVLTGTIGEHSLAVLSAREGLGFEARVQSDCAPLSAMILPVIGKNSGVHALRDLTRGGLRGALCDLAEAADLDVRIDLDAVPVQREVRAGCEMLGLDPIDMVNEGKMLIVVTPDDVGAVLDALREQRHGAASAVIGQACRSRGGQPQVCASGAAGEVVLQRLEGEAIPRLC